ncbi:MAG: prepilin-type N-terminal cleavage/methylation domain-containing protein [Planctomycetota bacterium]
MFTIGYRRRSAFSLVELVVVVVILGVIAAIALPRMSRGAAGAADAGLATDLSVMRSAIELYRSEHAGTYPSVANIVNQLTQYTNEAGATSATASATHIYGPYLTRVPTLKVSANRGNSGIAAAAGAGVGWIYDETAGTIIANSGTDTDSSGTLYSAY